MGSEVSVATVSPSASSGAADPSNREGRLEPAMVIRSEEATTATRIDVVTSHDVIETGLKTLLEGRHHELQITTSGPSGTEPDVIFYDVIGLHEGDGSDLDHWVKETASIVIALTRELRPDLGATALERGAEAAISLGATREDFLEVVQAATRGSLSESPVAQGAAKGTRVGSDVGLTLRESEVISLVVRGLCNRDIADKCFLSCNSVKSYIRSAYRKMAVSSRPQAVKWGVQHGFPLDSEPLPELLREVARRDLQP